MTHDIENSGRDVIGYAGPPDLEPYFVARVTLRDGSIRECRIAPTRPMPGQRTFIRGPSSAHPIVEIPLEALQSKVDHADILVRQYACAIGDGAALPPIRVRWDGAAYEIADGNHRVAAAQALGHSHVLAYVEVAVQ